MSVPPISPCFFALACPLFLSFLSTLVLYAANFSMDSTYLFLGPSYTLQYFLDCAIPPCSSSPPFLSFSRTALSAMVGNLFFWHVTLLYMASSTFSSLLFHITSSALNSAFVVVLEHPSSSRGCSLVHGRRRMTIRSSILGGGRSCVHRVWT